MAQNWNGGNRLTITQSNGAQCVNSIVNPINVAFVYNTTQAAQDILVNFTGSNQYFGQVNVPQTTGNQGSAALLTFSGPPGGSGNLSAIVDSSSGTAAQVETWLGSQALPTNTAGLNNFQLQANGEQYSFNKYARAFFVPSAQRYILTVRTGIKAFYFAVFDPSGGVTVYVLNAPDQNYKPTVRQFTNDTYAINNTKVNVVTSNYVQISLFGQNQQWVLMNADSLADSANATVQLQAV